MSYDYDDEFKEKMESHLRCGSIGGHDTDINQIVYTLGYEVKEYFPMNKVPQSIVDSIYLLKEKFEIAEKQLGITLELIINEVEKLDKLHEEKKC
jgi:hypothetical protein